MSMQALFNFRAATTVLLGTAYVGALIWALMAGRVDAESFVAGIGPSFGMALGYWFRDSEAKP